LQFSATEKVYIWLDFFDLAEGEKRRLLRLADSPIKLVQRFTEYEAFFQEIEKKSVFQDMVASLCDNGAFFKERMAALEKQGIMPIAICSDAYPKEWKNLPDAPLVAYAKGNIVLLQKRKFVIVGSRRTPAGALKIGAEIAKDISQTFVIATGAADGGDSAAIEGGLAGGGNVICVLAGGFGTLPQVNLSLLNKVAERGLLLSPYTHDTTVRTYSYEYRNKLLAALGEGVLVLGAAEKSGALITAKYAEEFKKMIFALPYFPGVAAGAGNNLLLKKGAKLTESGLDVLETFGVDILKEKPQIELTKEEQAVMDALRDLSEAHISELSAKTSVPTFKLMAMLSALEVKGIVVKLGGNRYAPV